MYCMLQLDIPILPRKARQEQLYKLKSSIYRLKLQDLGFPVCWKLGKEVVKSGYDQGSVVQFCKVVFGQHGFYEI